MVSHDIIYIASVGPQRTDSDSAVLILFFLLKEEDRKKTD